MADLFASAIIGLTVATVTGRELLFSTQRMGSFIDRNANAYILLSMACGAAMFWGWAGLWVGGRLSRAGSWRDWLGLANAAGWVAMGMFCTYFLYDKLRAAGCPSIARREHGAGSDVTRGHAAREAVARSRSPRESAGMSGSADRTTPGGQVLPDPACASYIGTSTDRQSTCQRRANPREIARPSPGRKARAMPNRRDVFRLGALALGNLFALALAVPGLKYLLDPLGKSAEAKGYRPIARLGQLEVDRPQSFSVIENRLDAWVKYPEEPIGTVWLVRQPAGANPPVLAFSAECPHLSCAVKVGPDRKSFLCPCHAARFQFDGSRINEVAARGMDSLPVELSDEKDPEIRVKFERFQPQIAEKKTLA
ncbi:ubiquinol-cytochrome c reductase iron-sulfur subunit [Tundrisphaera lichenicola]|uniref:QcrA and Rieske domain-containing protein n=1 Tax=Tundrisphaera lichenicola TaxID=2029860 RepID=UPI003EBC51C1